MHYAIYLNPESTSTCGQIQLVKSTPKSNNPLASSSSSLNAKSAQFQHDFNLALFNHSHSFCRIRVYHGSTFFFCHFKASSRARFLAPCPHRHRHSTFFIAFCALHCSLTKCSVTTIGIK
ncbi:hypothetical protein QR680_008153 [Steinernema hermaphroditum]|uniref:Uncharacterized protein n=1 Tax=Steinernema hermaphroditum TaxID=289476 RepID=A0AA39IFK9_9BILA|nr:hypothetical protein QR680_008153 [Steinernema hermaphroditum]